MATILLLLLGFLGTARGTPPAAPPPPERLTTLALPLALAASLASSPINCAAASPGWHHAALTLRTLCPAAVTKEQQIAMLDPGNCEPQDVMRVFKAASTEHRDDADVAMMAVRSGPPTVLADASERLRGDKEFFMGVLALEQKSFALKHASSALQADREVVDLAMRDNAWALKFAAEEFREDREIILHAIKQSGSLLQLAPSLMRADPDLVLTGTFKFPRVLKDKAWNSFETEQTLFDTFCFKC